MLILTNDCFQQDMYIFNNDGSYEHMVYASSDGTLAACNLNSTRSGTWQQELGTNQYSISFIDPPINIEVQDVEPDIVEVSEDANTLTVQFNGAVENGVLVEYLRETFIKIQ